MDGVFKDGAKTWERHEDSVRHHANDWLTIRKDYPDHTLVVAGDYNQALDGVGQYRNEESTQLLNDAFAKADLRCLTEENFSARTKLSRHSIDHIAISDSALTHWENGATAWKGPNSDGDKLSDHNRVTVTLRGTAG